MSSVELLVVVEHYSEEGYLLAVDGPDVHNVKLMDTLEVPFNQYPSVSKRVVKVTPARLFIPAHQVDMQSLPDLIDAIDKEVAQRIESEAVAEDRAKRGCCVYCGGIVSLDRCVECGKVDDYGVERVKGDCTCADWGMMDHLSTCPARHNAGDKSG